jgi:hypothetical protein
MQGTWKEKFDGSFDRKGIKRKKHNRKHTIKDKRKYFITEYIRIKNRYSSLLYYFEKISYFKNNTKSNQLIIKDFQKGQKNFSTKINNSSFPLTINNLLIYTEDDKHYQKRKKQFQKNNIGKYVKVFEVSIINKDFKNEQKYYETIDLKQSKKSKKTRIVYLDNGYYYDIDTFEMFYEYQVEIIKYFGDDYQYYLEYYNDMNDIQNIEKTQYITWQDDITFLYGKELNLGGKLPSSTNLYNKFDKKFFNRKRRRKNKINKYSNFENINY